jgi:hypothetical protein
MKREAENKGSHNWIGTGPWSAEEDEALRRAVSRYEGKNWKAVASEVQTRTHIQCMQRWSKALKPNLGKGRWNSNEDDFLIKLVGEHGTDWNKVASVWQSEQPKCRTCKQIRDRWVKKLDPNVSREPYTENEDKLILELHQEHGNLWTKIAKHLPGRVGESVKTRFQALERARAKEGPVGPVKKLKTEVQPAQKLELGALAAGADSVCRCGTDCAAIYTGTNMELFGGSGSTGLSLGRDEIAGMWELLPALLEPKPIDPLDSDVDELLDEMDAAGVLDSAFVLDSAGAGVFDSAVDELLDAGADVFDSAGAGVFDSAGAGVFDSPYNSAGAGVFDAETLLDEVEVADAFTALLEHELRVDSSNRGPEDMLEEPLLQAQQLPREKAPNSSLVNFLQCCPRLLNDSDDTDGESDDSAYEGIDSAYEGIERKGEEEGDATEEGTQTAAGSDAGSEPVRGFLLADSAFGCPSRPFNLRLTWLRLVVTAVTCVCAVVSLSEYRQHVASPQPLTPVSPEPYHPPAKSWALFKGINAASAHLVAPKHNSTSAKYLGEFDSYTACWAACNSTLFDWGTCHPDGNHNKFSGIQCGCPGWVWFDDNQHTYNRQCYVQYFMSHRDIKNTQPGVMSASAWMGNVYFDCVDGKCRPQKWKGASQSLATCESGCNASTHKPAHPTLRALRGL